MGYLSLDAAPSADIPTISYASLGATAAPVVSGGVWLREKRTGAAESTGVGGSGNALDVTGSTRFWYPGLRSAVGFSGNTTQYVQSDMKPGGTPQNAYWVAAIDFITDAPAVEIRLNAPAASLRLGLIFVNGKPIQGIEAVRTTGRTAGNGYSATLTFPSAATRRITIYDLNNILGRFGGVAVPTGYTVTKPSAPGKTIAFIADSYGAGAGAPPTGAAVSETFLWRMGILMGADVIINAGIGATGIITTLSGQPTSNFAGRVSDVLAMNPDAVVIAGGRNDSASGLQAALESLIDSLATVPELYVMPTASNSGAAAVRTAMAAACTIKGVPFLDVNIDTLPKNPDGIHPTWQGHQDLADAAFALLPASTVEIAATVPVVSSTTASIRKRAPLAATVLAVSGVTGAVGRRTSLAATVPVVAAVTGVVRKRTPLTATTPVVSAASGVVGKRTSLSATVTATSTVSASLTPDGGLSATVTASSTVTATVRKRSPLTALTPIVSGVSVALSAPDSLAATVTIATSVQGRIGKRSPLAATVPVMSMVWCRLDPGGISPTDPSRVYRIPESPRTMLIPAAPRTYRIGAS